MVAGSAIVAPGADAAARAWREVSGQEAGDVELVHEREKSSVYRLDRRIVAKRAKPETVAVERVVYEQLLPALKINSGYLGSFEGEESHWLFLDDAGGVPYEFYSESHPEAVGTWLGSLHGLAAAVVDEFALPDRSVGYFLGRLARARDAVVRRLGEERLDAAGEAILRRAIEQCDRLESYWPELERFETEIPPTLVHGDFAASNVQVWGSVVIVFDWEKAGRGFPAVDLIRGLDLARYRDAYGTVDDETVEQLARYAKILRPLTHEWARKSPEKIERYHAHMGDAMAALGWESSWEADRAKRVAFRSTFPADEELCGRLTEVFGDRVTVFGREPNPQRSTFPSEIVRCLAGGVEQPPLLCKYGLSHKHAAHGHRAGSRYEADVYERELAPRGLGPSFFGATTIDDRTWIVTEYLDGAVRLDWTDPVPAFLSAATWVGGFHRMLAEEPPAFLRAYDREYYGGWARRTLSFAGPLRDRHGWLEQVCRAFEATAVPLLLESPTVIHGEYTPHNVLVRGEQILPVDWESAAVAAGEIDLAALCDGWPADLVQRAEAAYVEARWAGLPPCEFGRRLAAARMYWALRWLGERADWTLGAKCAQRWPRLHAAAAALDLVAG
ncbi:MAG: phosphotransferase [Actinobacteria bacterium]|nr:phosphotransferase [Actinomycetota bacterium]